MNEAKLRFWTIPVSGAVAGSERSQPEAVEGVPSLWRLVILPSDCNFFSDFGHSLLVAGASFRCPDPLNHPSKRPPWTVLDGPRRYLADVELACFPQTFFTALFDSDGVQQVMTDPLLWASAIFFALLGIRQPTTRSIEQSLRLFSVEI